MCTKLKETPGRGGWAWADDTAGMWQRSAKQGEPLSCRIMGGRVQTTVALLVFWLLEYFTFVKLRCVVERDQRPGWVGVGGCLGGCPGEVGEAGRGRASAQGARTGTKSQPEPLKRCPSIGQDVVLMSVNNLQHFLMRLPKT